MKQYIDKDIVKTEIERCIKYDEMVMNHDAQITELLSRELNTLYKLSSFIKSLEMKEVDLEKEIQDHIKECLDVKFPTTNIELIKKDVEYTARKFFELGLKTKGE